MRATGRCRTDVLFAGLVVAALALAGLGLPLPGRAVPLTSSDLQVALTGSPTTGQPPLNISLMASAAGGIAPYNYSWTVEGGAPEGYGPTFSHLFTLAGTYNVTVYATDAFGEPGNASVSVDVLPPTLAVALGATPSSLAADTATYLEANASGGNPPYSYAWSGLPPGCLPEDAASLRCVPTMTGGYTVHVNVTDGSGSSATALVGLVVTAGSAPGPSPGPSSPGPSISLWELAAILAVAAVGGAGLGILARTRLRRKR